MIEKNRISWDLDGYSVAQTTCLSRTAAARLPSLPALCPLVSLDRLHPLFGNIETNEQQEHHKQFPAALLDALRGEQEPERDQHSPQRQSETQIHDKLHVLLTLSLDHCLLGALSSPVTPETPAGTANTVRAASIRAWTRIA